MNLKKHILSTFIYLLLIFIVFAMLLREASLHDIADAVRGASLPSLAAGLLFMVFAVSCEGLNLKKLLQVLDHEKPLKSCLRYAFIGHYFTSVTPGASGGQPAQLYYMAKDGIPVGSASVALLMYNLSYHIGIIAVYSIIFLFRSSLIAEMIGAFKILLIAGLAVHAVLLLFFLAIIFRPQAIAFCGSILTKMLAKIRLIRHPERAEISLARQTAYYRKGAEYIKSHPVIFLRIQPITLLQLAVMFSVPFFVFTAFGLSGFNLLDLLALQASVTLIADAVPMPGGVGISEAAFSAVYAGIFGSAFLLPSVILCRMIGYYLPVAISGLLTLLLASRRKTRSGSGASIV